jgi:predicted esterase
MQTSGAYIANAVAVMASTFAVGCSTISLDSDLCTVGRSEECACDDDLSGVRVCVDGSNYSECECEQTGKNKSLITGASSEDSPVRDMARGNVDRSGEGGKHSDASGGAGGSAAHDGTADDGGSVASGGTGTTTASAPSSGQGGTTASGTADDGGSVASGGTGTTTAPASSSGQGGTTAHGGTDAAGGTVATSTTTAASGGQGGTVAAAGGTKASGGTTASGGKVATGGTTASGGRGGTVAAAGGTTGAAGTDYRYFCTTAPAKLPTPTGTCPTLKTTYNSDYSASTPITIKGKKADIIIGPKPNATSKGPFIFYWHGLGATPTQDIINALNPSFAPGIFEKGGVVVGLYGDQTRSGGTIVLDFDHGHLAAADELLACAIQQIGIDTCRIHAAGFSMGGLMTTQMSYLRSNYLASVISYSGGINSAYRAPTDQDSSNKLAAMVVHGGSSDSYGGIDFPTASTNFYNDLKSNGHFAFICNHGAGHNVPNSIGIPAWQFFRDHPYGVKPEPYASGLPSIFPSYCKLNP